MNKILITGSAGFIGSNITSSMLKKGWQVIGLDNLNDYYRTDWKHENLANFKNNPNFIFFHEDILNKNKLNQIFNKCKPDVVLHLAARAGVRPSIEDPFIYQKVNIEGTLNLLDLAREYKIKKFIFASSSSVYGNKNKTPFSENDKISKPASPYAASKAAGELFVHTFSELYDIPSICLRFFSVYGPSGRPDMAPYIFTDAVLNNKTINKFGNGRSSRDYTYVDDIVDGITAAVDFDCKFDIFNLGNSNTVSLNEFIETIENLTSTKAILKLFPSQPGEVDKTFADISKARKYLKFEPKIKIKEGMAKFIDWYRQNRYQSPV